MFAPKLANARALLLGLAASMVLSLALPPSGARASLVEAMSLRELVAASDEIVVARVEDQRARYDARGRIVTDVTLRVEERLYGRLSAGERATALRLGGAVGERGMRVEGEAIYETGERVLLFARRVTTERGELLRPVGMSQGLFPIRGEEGGETILPSGAGLELVVRTPTGALAPGAPPLAAPRPRDEVLAEVRELVEERRRAE